MNKKISSSLKQLVKINQIGKSNDIDIVMYVQNVELAISQIKQLDKNISVHSFDFINAVGLSISPNYLDDLSNFKNVKHITCARVVSLESYRAMDITNINKLHAQGLSGKGVTVAVIDTGTFSHFDLCFPENKVKKFVNLVGDRQRQFDDNGHGTFVAGLIAGGGFISNRKFKGIAYNSEIVSIKAINEKGETSAFYILKAMEWVFEHADEYNIKVVCMSFGSEPLDEKDPLVLGAESLWDKGITVVAAAGNSGPDYSTIKSPAVSPKILTVGAIDDGRDLKENKTQSNSILNNMFFNNNLKNEKYLERIKLSKCSIASFSSRGPVKNHTKPDVVAPGVKIVGISNEFKEPYCIMSGTSMATPIVAGLVCLMLENDPTLTPDQIKMKIKRSGRRISYNQNEEGNGLIDALRCI